MKKLSMILSVLWISILITVPAFAQLAYQIDVGQNGTFETGGFITLGVSQSVTMDIYVSGYTCSPSNGLLGTLKHILLDESMVSVSGFAYDTDNLGPWDAGFSDFFQDEPNVYNLSTGDFDFVTVVGGIQKLGTMTITGTADGCFTMRVANDLTSSGYGTYNDGFISDCNLARQYPADAVLDVAVGSVAETDGDGVPNCVDNCPITANPDQQDTYPPQGNGIGNVCDCEGNFNCDQDVDGADASLFKADFGRSAIVRPCNAGSPCNGNFNCDQDVDGADASLFKADFGRSAIVRPCPVCTTGAWCVY